MKKTAVKKELYFPEDYIIIKGCINSEPMARKYLYEKYCRLLFTTAYYIVYDYDMSNDILHDSYIKIYNNISTLKNNSSLVGWMRKIVVNTSLKMIKRYRRIEYTEEEISSNTITWSEPMSGEYLEKAIFTLSNGYRIIFTLIEIEGYKHREVAEILNISIGTSKSQLYYAKKQLKRIIGSHI